MAKENIYLAVDFFFVLSGFVFGYAYDDRWDVFGFFPDGPQYTVIGGWSLTSKQIYIGFTRLLYPFLCGLLISRILPSSRSESNPSGSPIHLKGGFWWCSLALVVIFPIRGAELRKIVQNLYKMIILSYIWDSSTCAQELDPATLAKRDARRNLTVQGGKLHLTMPTNRATSNRPTASGASTTKKTYEPKPI